LLIAKLTSLLPSKPLYSRAEILRAFRGLSSTDFEWSAQLPGAMPAPIDSVLLATANHALPILFERQETAYRIATDMPDALSINLSVPTRAKSTHNLEWSLSSFLEQQANPEAFAYQIDVESPFDVGELLVTNDLPLHESGIRQLDVEIRTGGPGPEMNHRFEPDGTSATRLAFVNETFRDRTMNAKISAIVMKSGQPIIINKSIRPVGAVLAINKTLMQLEPVNVQAVDAVFDHLNALEIQLGSRLLTLAYDRILQLKSNG